MKSAPNTDVSLRGVGKRYGGKPILEDLDLRIDPNRLTAVIGPSGCGKSTLINLIAGYETPDAGLITCNGVRVESPKWDRLVVFQETALFPWKTTLENVTFGPISQGVNRREAISQARALMEKFGLTGFEDKYPAQLSGGMQRRAELARAIINCPGVMLLDEPFRGLDALTRELMQEYLLQLFEEHRITTVFVTSEIEESIYLADVVIVLSAAPASVKKIVEVDLPRPRDVQMLTSRRFGEIQKDILENLFEVGSKAFAL
jgi:NitT/TauT family transport system ATP-binding protein